MHMADKEQQRVRQAVWHVKEAEATKDRQRQTDIERLAQRVTFESRQAEIDRQQTPIEPTATELRPSTAKEAAPSHLLPSEAQKNAAAAARALWQNASPAPTVEPGPEPSNMPDRSPER